MNASEAAFGRIKEATGENLFVEAGAGSGKTAALVARYVALVEDGCAPERLVAITFTEKAAAELRERIRTALEEKAAADRGGQAEAALESLDAAPISTIHAFASDIVRVSAAELGVDPDFGVMDEVALGRHVQQRWRDTLEHLGADGVAREAFGRALRLGLAPRQMEKLATELWPRVDYARQLAARPAIAHGARWPDVAAMARTLAELHLDRRPAADELAVRLRRLQSLVEQLVPADDAGREAALAASGVAAMKFGVGKRASFGSDIASAQSAGNQVRDLLKETLEARRGEALETLLPFIARAVLDDLEARCRAGTLSFDDLIVLARDALTRQAATRERLRARYDRLLIDEFQDTDAIQWDIARAFAGAAGGRLEPGRLFVVGDPKQSIYRFRGADMAMYAEARRTMTPAHSAPVVLGDSWRSTGTLVEWVNRVFASAFRTIDDAAVSPTYWPLAAVRRDRPFGPAVSWFGEPDPGTAMPEIRRREAADVVAACEAIARSWEVSVRDGASRPAALRDIAILMPTRTLLPELERSLERAGLAARVESGSLVFQTQEVRDVINALTALADPSDLIATVAALRSPLFACSDTELAEHKLAGGSFNSNARGQSTGPVADAIARLTSLRVATRDLGLAETVERVLAETGAVASAIIDRGDRDSYRRARFMVERARAFEANGPQPLRAFVEWLERRSDAPVFDHEGTLLDDDEDAVRILTVHAAKGLEFPIVIMAGFGSGPPNVELTFGAGRDGEVAAGVGTKDERFAAGPYEDELAHERLHQEAEQLRLLYVAATRARDHLVISRHMKNSTRCGVAVLDAARMIEGVERMELPATSRVHAGRSRFPGLEVELAPGGEDVEQFGRDRTALVAGAPRLRVTSATALRTDPYGAKSERGDDSEPWSRGRGGTRRGRAVHAVIQSVRFDANDQEIREFALAQAVAEAVPAATDEIAALARAALASGPARRARLAARVLREVPFAATIAGALVEGFLDMAILTQEGVEVVDWKTDAISAGAVESRMAGYRVQAGLYVLGIEEATRLRVHRVTFVFLGPGIEHELDDIEALRREAFAALASA